MKKIVLVALLLGLAGCKSGMQRCTSDKAESLVKITALVPGTDEKEARQKAEKLAEEQCRAIQSSCDALKDAKPEGCVKYFPDHS